VGNFHFLLQILEFLSRLPSLNIQKIQTKIEKGIKMNELKLFIVEDDEAKNNNKSFQKGH
jgi:hypothetical protein